MEAIIDSHLQLLGNWNQARRNRIRDHLFPSFNEAAGLVTPTDDLKKLEKTVSSLRDAYTGQNRVTVSAPQVQSLMAYMLFIHDMLLVGLQPELYDHAAANNPAVIYDPPYPVFTPHRGLISLENHKSRLAMLAEDEPDMTALDKFPKAENEVPSYLRSTTMNLRRMYGINGVPLLYLIRPNPIPEDARPLLNDDATDYIDIAIRCCNINHISRRNDEKTLYKFLYKRVVDTDSLASAPLNHEITQVGSVFYHSIWTARMNGAGQETNKNATIADYEKLYYKGESSRPFLTFLTQFKKFNLDLENYGVPTSWSMKITQLKMKITTSPVNSILLGGEIYHRCKSTEAHFNELVDTIQQAVTSTNPVSVPKGANRRRQVASLKKEKGKPGKKKAYKGKDSKPKAKIKYGDKWDSCTSKKLDDWLGCPRNAPEDIYKSWTSEEKKQFRKQKREAHAVLDAYVASSTSQQQPTPPTVIPASNSSVASALTFSIVPHNVSGAASSPASAPAPAPAPAGPTTLPAMGRGSATGPGR